MICAILTSKMAHVSFPSVGNWLLRYGCHRGTCFSTMHFAAQPPFPPSDQPRTTFHRISCQKLTYFSFVVSAFIDCGVTLSSGGKIKCKTHFMDKGTICEISCHHYEDKAAVPPKFYGCNIDGSWTPELPFCARAGSGKYLVYFHSVSLKIANVTKCFKF